MLHLRKNIETVVEEISGGIPNGTNIINVNIISKWFNKFVAKENYESCTVSDVKTYVLQWSLEYACVEIAKFLIESDNKIDINSHNNRALLTSVSKGYLEIVKLLIEKGVDGHTTSGNILSLSVSGGHLEIVKILVENGADVHANNDCALKWSIYCRYPKIINYLVERYIENDKWIPNHLIGNTNNDTNRILIRGADPRQYHLFHPEIVEELSMCKRKSARNI